jgi:hypothetical protein
MLSAFDVAYLVMFGLTMGYITILFVTAMVLASRQTQPCTPRASNGRFVKREQA